MQAVLSDTSFKTPTLVKFEKKSMQFGSLTKCGKIFLKIPENKIPLLIHIKESIDSFSSLVGTTEEDIINWEINKNKLFRMKY